MSKRSEMMIVAPFWGNPHHVGVYRIARFVRWLSAQRVDTVLVRAGRTDRVQPFPWGVEITVRDPLGLHNDPLPGSPCTFSTRHPNRVRRFAAYLLLNPDPTVVWARRAARHPLVLEHGKGIRWVLSSNPPESSHVAAALVAKHLQAELIVDMRDGWLDEPLKPLLQHLRLQRWREGRLETRILRQAKHIFVTSDVWKELLEHRLSFTRGKITVLTNSYPPGSLQADQEQRKRSPSSRIRLIYAGRFTGSRSTRTVKHLLEPLLIGMRSLQTKGKMVLLGNLERADLDQVASFRPQFEAAGWSLVVRPPVPREEMIRQLYRSDGLLLLTVSHATIPIKFFEYLPTTRPILAITPEGSAVWRLSGPLPQVFLLDFSQPHRAASVTADFIAACSAEEWPYRVPPSFAEERLGHMFLKAVELS